MTTQLFSLKDIAARLKRKPYQIAYLLTTGQIKEPRRIGGKRVFTANDLKRLAKHFGVECIDNLPADQGGYDV